MTRQKLFIFSLIGFLLIPIYWVASSTYDRYQVAAKAEALFNEIPSYPGSTPIEKSLSFYNIGYGYKYRVNDDPEKILNFYPGILKDSWVFDTKSGTASSKDISYKNLKDNLNLIITVSKADNQPLTSPPYDLIISVYKP